MVADPYTVDVAKLKKRVAYPHSLLLMSDFIDLITEVEELRKRVAWLNKQLNNHESMLAKSRGETNTARMDGYKEERLAG